MGKCNLCGFFIVKINSTVFGTRCINCRSTYIHRAMGIVLNSKMAKKDLSVYEISAHGAFFNYLKKRFKRFTYSEYFDDVTPGEFSNGIQCQDVQRLTFKDNSFDLVSCTEVFEHVPDDHRGFQEVYRVLQPGGFFIFTVPMTKDYKTIERAFIENGEIKHILQPEYHGDHLRSKGVLAFRNYGLDILERLKKVGFSTELIEVENKKNRITPTHVIVGKKETY